MPRGLCVGMAVAPWYALLGLSVFGVLPLDILWYVLLPTVFFGFGSHSWSRYRGYRWWMELLVVPIGFVGWVLVRLDVPDHLDPRYRSLYDLSMLSGNGGLVRDWRHEGRYINERPGLLVALLDLVMVGPLLLAWQYTFGRLLVKWFC